MTKIRVDPSELTGRDFIAIEEATGKPMADAMASAAGIFAVAWRLQVRVDPAFTYDQALDLALGDLEVVNTDAEGEAPAAGNGGTPSALPVSGG